MSNVVLVIKVEKIKDYLTFVMGSQNMAKGVHGIRTMQDFLDVFPDELPRLPSDYEVEFTIKLYPISSLV